MSKYDDGSLREQERFIHQIAELTPVVLTVFDLVTQHDIYISSDVINMHGYTPDELTWMKDLFTDLLHPEDALRVRDHFARLKQAEDGEVREIEYRIRHRNGEWRWLRSRHMPFARNDQGVVQQVVTATLDITERKQAEAALQRAHNELERRVIERTEQLTAVNAELVKEITERERAEAQLIALKDELAAELTAMKHLHQFSTQLLATTEHQMLLEEVLNATVELQNADFGNVQLYNPQTGVLEIVAHRGFRQDFLDHFRSVHEDSAACGRTMQQRQRVIIEDVETDPGFKPHRQIAASAGFRAVQSTPLFSRHGEPLGIISTHFRETHRPSERELRLTDLYARQAAEMIERKGVEAALKRSESYLAEGQRLSHTGSGAWNVSTGEVFWSQETYRIYGFDPETAKPSNELFFQILHPEDRPFVEQSFERVISSGSNYEMEFRLIRPDGNIRYVHSVGHPVFNEAGEIVQLVGTVMDITERKRAEEALQDEIEERRGIEEERLHLLRRTVMAQEGERGRIAREMHDQFGQQLSALTLKLAMLKEGCGEQTELCEQIEQLQAIAKQLDGDVDFLVWELRPTALDDLGLLAALTNYVKGWSKHFIISAELHTSGMEKDRLTSEIETVLYRIMQEALTNIAKHAGAENVDILLERRNDHISLIVEDDGVGFEAEQAFGAGDKGLGLIGMRERAALVGGTLEIESSMGNGATVVVRIPVPNIPFGAEAL